MKKALYKQSAIALVLAAAISAYFEWKKLPMSILIGGSLGLANHRALSWGVMGMLDVDRSYVRLLFFSMFRLLIIFLILFVLIMLKLVNILGILIGFTIVFTLILKEGFLAAKKMD